MSSAQIEFSHSIRGVIVGNLWMGGEAWKDVSHDCSAYDRRCIWSLEPEKTQNTLAEHVEHICNDGDFAGHQGMLADAQLVTRLMVTRGGRRYVRERRFELARFPSIAALYDAEFIPDYPE